MIPVFEPEVGEEEIQAVVAALRRGEISGSFGQALTEFEKEFSQYCGCRHGVAMSSGTAALQAAVAAAGIGPGDEVLLSASTNIATALAILHMGALPVPIDSEAVTWNVDLDLLQPHLTPRTRAVMPVHLYGHPVDMDRLMAFADRHELTVIEDCAEAHGATCRGRVTGSLGHMGCFSFYANKVITTGEGGMVVTNDDSLASRLRSLRNLAFTTPRFRHEEAGYNFRMTGYQAAMGLAQLKKIDAILQRKRHLAHRYSLELSQVQHLQLPAEQPWATNVYWMYAVVLEAGFPSSRDELMAYLQRQGIETRTFFCPMNLQPCLLRTPGFRAVPCPVAERLWERGLYLPSSPQLSDDSVRYICRHLGRASLARDLSELA